MLRKTSFPSVFVLLHWCSQGAAAGIVCSVLVASGCIDTITKVARGLQIHYEKHNM
eukprot:SAG22_NODE_878_length_6715_cov_9.368652_7_plen_56_part_00